MDAAEIFIENHKFESINMQYYSINSNSFQAFWNFLKTLFYCILTLYMRQPILKLEKIPIVLSLLISYV